MTKDDTVKAIDDLRRDIRADLRALKDGLAEIKELKEMMQTVLKENQALKAENSKLSRRIEELEQYQRLNNLEIKGVPLDGEPITMLKKIGSLAKVELTDADIDACHRVPTARHDQSNIIVRFVQRTKRNDLLAQARKMRLTTKDLGLESSCPVYVNEHLTRQSKQILGAAVQRKKQVNWKFVWTAGKCTGGECTGGEMNSLLPYVLLAWQTWTR